VLGNAILRAVLGGLLAALLLTPRVTWGAACVQACKDEIAACVTADCQAQPTPGAKRRCKRHCSKTIVNDCYHDLSVCGATRARPAKPGPASGPPQSGGW
jgi:hypothetical protein